MQSCEGRHSRWLFDSIDCRTSIERLTKFHRTRDVVCELLRDRSGSVRYPTRKTVVLNHKEMAKMFQQTTEFDGEISPTNFQPDFCEFRPQVLTAIGLPFWDQGGWTLLARTGAICNRSVQLKGPGWAVYGEESYKIRHSSSQIEFCKAL